MLFNLALELTVLDLFHSYYSQLYHFILLAMFQSHSGNVHVDHEHSLNMQTLQHT